MAIYAFKCNACDNCFEKVVDMGTEETLCPSCAGVSKKDFNGSAQFNAHGLPNGFCGSRSTVNENVKARLQ